jgi:dihydrofolate synthase/folylpolyglutamate synthase
MCYYFVITMHHFSSLTDAEKALEPFHPSRLKRFAYTTEHVQEFLHSIGDPQDVPRAIHIAGTSGKTSTAYYAASLLKQAGKRVGLLVSPHIETINERVQVDLQPLPEREFCDELAIFLELIRKSSITLTYAEIMYAFAYWEFVRQGVEYIVVETGMGGLLDATNVITRQDKVCIITDIGLDHMHVLGRTLPDIARHKAGIILQHNTVFCHAQTDDILGVIKKACQQHHADLHILGTYAAPSSLPIFQQRNFSLAAAAIRFTLERAGSTLTDAQIRRASEVVIPGRMETFRIKDRILVLDGAHNPQKLQALRHSLAEQFPDRQCAAVCAFVDSRGRDLPALVSELAPFADHIIATSLQSVVHHRVGRSPKDIAAACNEAGYSSVEIVDNPRDAYRVLLNRPEDLLVVTGSFHLLEVIRPLARALQ